MTRMKHPSKQQLEGLAQRTSKDEMVLVKDAANDLPEKESRILLDLIRGQEPDAVHAAPIPNSSFSVP